MKYIPQVVIIGISVSVALLSCSKKGCTDSIAENFNPDAKNEDGSCIYIYGCTDISASNYNQSATKDDGSCIFNGSIVFWQDGTPSYGVTYVTIENVTESIITDYTFYSPDCSASDCAVFKLPSGNYYYYAQEGSGPGFWDGYVNVQANFCTQVLLE